MEFRPHKYQDYAREFIIGHPVCALILDMGLGKTVITLTALWELALDYFEVGKVLVIAPFRVARDTWKEELEKWDHLKGLSVSVVVGSEKERLDALEKKASVYVINRENVVWLCEKHHWDFDMIVIDELSSFKNDLHSEARPNITIHKPTSKTAKRALHTSCRRRSVSMQEGPPRTTARQARAR